MRQFHMNLLRRWPTVPFQVFSSTKVGKTDKTLSYSHFFWAYFVSSMQENLCSVILIFYLWQHPSSVYINLTKTFSARTANMKQRQKRPIKISFIKEAIYYLFCNRSQSNTFARGQSKSLLQKRPINISCKRDQSNPLFMCF